PEQMIESLPLMTVVFRQRKLGIRRIFQIAEVLEGPKTNTIYNWRARDDKMQLVGKSKRIFHDVETHTGVTQKELEQELYQKQQILAWLTKANLSSVNAIGKIISTYYLDKNTVLSAVKKNADPKSLLTPDILHELGMRKK
ncbi:hypothetical protein KY339_04020, partial [Candidatus Woesearchaeota archaeon]|nr:hypothetical protein [Candidatus Woesearchaeota archaeon]